MASLYIVFAYICKYMCRETIHVWRESLYLDKRKGGLACLRCCRWPSDVIDTHVHIHIFIYIYLCEQISTYIAYIHISMAKCVGMYARLCMYAYIHTNISTRMCKSMHVCMYLYIV
jgi:hypothetical protein